MEETKATHEKPERPASTMPLVHRVCEGCNNMFAAPADSPERRCPHCRKGHE